MTSILEEFAYGNVCPQAQYFEKDSEYGKAMQCVSSNGQKLLERLGAEDKQIFENYVAMQSEVNRLTAVNNFMYGYKLGLIMTAEAFVGRGDLVVGEEV